MTLIDIAIIHANELITLDSNLGAPRKGRMMSNLGTISDGAVGIKDGKIKFVGSTTDLLSQYEIDHCETVINAKNQLVSPGFVDPHTHIIFKGSRENELEADKLGMDLVMRAGYNYEEFPAMIENVYDAQMGKSGRLKQVSEKIDEVIQDNLIDSDNNQWEAIVEAAKVKKAIKAKDMIIDEIALNTKEYEDSTTRIEILKQYINNEYDDDLPPEVTAKPYKSVIDGRASKARLEQDLDAVEVLNALNNDKFDVAKKKALNLHIGSRQDVISGVIAKSLVEAWNKNARVAANYLARLTKDNPHAPAEAYTKLAEIYIADKKYSQAEEILKLGINRIGRDYKFLPTLIYLKVADGKTEEAENYTLECQKYDSERKDSLILSFFANSIYYEKCASILGYDVRAKNNPDTSLFQDLRDLGAPITEKLKMPFER